MGTHYRGDEDTRRALDAFIKLTRANKTLGDYLVQTLKAEGVTESQFGTLEVLYHLGPMCQGEIGGKILRTGGNMTLVIDNLEKQGLVRRERDEADRRQVFVYLTDAGEQLISRVFPQHAENIREWMSVLDADEQEQLGALCKKLGTYQPSQN